MPYKDKEKQKRYQREWYARRRAEWFADKRCVDCGTRDDLELDHIVQSEKVTHRIWSWSKKRRDEELAKCVARCKPCHEKRTAQQNTKYASDEEKREADAARKRKRYDPAARRRKYDSTGV